MQAGYQHGMILRQFGKENYILWYRAGGIDIGTTPWCERPWQPLETNLDFFVLDDFCRTVLGCFLDLSLILRKVNVRLYMCRLRVIAEFKHCRARIHTQFAREATVFYPDFSDRHGAFPRLQEMRTWYIQVELFELILTRSQCQICNIISSTLHFNRVDRSHATLLKACWTQRSGRRPSGVLQLV